MRLATGTRADIDDLDLRDNGGPGNEVEQHIICVNANKTNDINRTSPPTHMSRNQILYWN